MKYKDHLDFEFIAPKRVCKPLLLSAFLFLALSFVAFAKGYYLLSFVAFVVFLTSNLYWRHPVKNSVYRQIDVVASVCLLVVGTHVALELNAQTFWFAALFLQVSLYTFNHFVYKRLVSDIDVLLENMFRDQQKVNVDFCRKRAYEKIYSDDKIMGNEIPYPLDFFTYAFIPHVTWPGTESREFAYRCGMIAHMVFVHIIPNICGIFCLIMFA